MHARTVRHRSMSDAIRMNEFLDSSRVYSKMDFSKICTYWPHKSYTRFSNMINACSPYPLISLLPENPRREKNWNRGTDDVDLKVSYEILILIVAWYILLDWILPFSKDFCRSGEINPDVNFWVCGEIGVCFAGSTRSTLQHNFIEERRARGSKIHGSKKSNAYFTRPLKTTYTRILQHCTPQRC